MYKPTYYIENLGNQTLGDELMALQTAGVAISEHAQMECLDRHGNQSKRNLYEIPQEVRDKVVRMARRAGFQFILYKKERDELPKEYYAELEPLRLDTIRKKRKLTAGRLPIGVFRGSSLLRH